MKKGDVLHYDYETQKWLRQHPGYCTTVTQCEDCGLFYKPSLGHKCKKKVKPNV